MKGNGIINRIWNRIGYSWKKSFSITTAIFAIVSTFASIAGVTLQNIFPLNWWVWLLIIISVYFIFVVIIKLVLSTHKTYTIQARKNNIEIKVGDIFKEKGVILIPFNEYFDTTVDDIVISSNSLNGKFLINCKIDVEELKKVIKEAADPKNLSRKNTARGDKFPLGRIIKYKQYLLLAFSHFDENNVAHISRIEYEHCLATMWKELRRTYNGEPIVLPLIGSGITSFSDLSEKSNLDLLKCMICTLKFSKEQFQEDIKIVVTEKVWNDLDLVNNIIEL